MAPSFVRIKLATGGSFAKLETRPGDDVSDLADRACAKFSHWGASPGMLHLYLVAEGGDEEPPDAAAQSGGTRLGAGWSLTRAGVASGAWLVARAAPSVARPAPTPAPAPKKFFLVVSGEDKWGEVAPVTMAVTLSTGAKLTALIKANGGGNLVLASSLPPYPNLSVKDVVDGETYTLFGGRQRAYLNEQNWTQQADKMLEEVSTLAVRDACGETMGELRVFLDTKVKNSQGEVRQFDGLLLNTTTAIAVEAKHVAMEKHIDIVLSGAEFLRQHALQASDERFRGITDVLPVLAANRFSDSMSALCEKQGIGVVKRNGAGLTYTPPPQRTPQLSQRSPRTLPGRRSFYTLARALRALL